jgi:probable F420-dependent oxidoreductase
MPDVFVVFTFMAAVTSRLRFGTDIYVLPLRHPMVSARAVATLDVLSKGRITLGVGLGWLPGEFDLAGIPWESRGQRTDECIRIMRALWSEEEASYEGEFYAFKGAVFEPKPVQKPGPPILIGGESARAMRRAAELGDGWCARNHTPAGLRDSVARLDEMRRTCGREGVPFTIITNIPRSASAGDARALHEAGASTLMVSMHGLTDSAVVLAEMESFAERVLGG